MKKKTKVGVAAVIGGATAIAGGLFAAKKTYEREGKNSLTVKEQVINHFSDEGEVCDIIIITNPDGYNVTANIVTDNDTITKELLLDTEFNIIN